MATLPGERLQVPDVFERVLSMPAGTIGILADSTARYTSFWRAVLSTLMPPGTMLHYAVGTTVLYGWNDIARELVKRPADQAAEWLWLLGDDHIWPSETLATLLAHDKDVVVPIVVRKIPPFQPVLYSDRLSNGKHRDLVLEEHPNGGLVRVSAAGSAGMLVRRRVFEALEPPWFEYGKLQSDGTGEDVYFCQKAIDAGFEVWADLDVAMGHSTTTNVYARRNVDGSWGIDFESADVRLFHLKRVQE